MKFQCLDVRLFVKGKSKSSVFILHLSCHSGKSPRDQLYSNHVELKRKNLRKIKQRVTLHCISTANPRCFDLYVWKLIKKIFLVLKNSWKQTFNLPSNQQIIKTKDLSVTYKWISFVQFQSCRSQNTSTRSQMKKFPFIKIEISITIRLFWQFRTSFHVLTF